MHQHESYFINPPGLGSRMWLARVFFTVVTKVITVVETVVDGKVVQSSKTVDVDVDEIEG